MGIKITDFLAYSDEQLKSLKELSLSALDLGTAQCDKFFPDVCAALAKCTAVETLNLSYNYLGQAGKTRVNMFGQALGKCKSLKSLDLGYNFDDSNLIELVKYLPALSESLESLNLNSNTVGSIPTHSNIRTFDEVSLATLGDILYKCRLESFSWNRAGFKSLSKEEFLSFWETFAPEVEALCDDEMDYEQARTTFVSPLKNLSLQTNDFTKFTDVLVYIAENCPELKVLSLGSQVNQTEINQLMVNGGFAGRTDLKIEGLSLAPPPGPQVTETPR